MSLYNELKRRNVIRVAAAYVAGAWLLIEISETLFPIYGLSKAAVRMVVTLLSIGLPITLILSWVYELTPEGLKLDKDMDRASPAPRESTKKLDRVIIVLMALALGYFAFDKFVLDPQQDIEIAETAAQAGAEQALEQVRLAKPDKKSIAVLAFADMSPDGDQEYFSDGLSDTLIHVLTQLSDLKVTAKTSSFYFKGKDATIAEIAEKLRVAHVLEGSVVKLGNRVRVLAQLTNAADGTHLWSKSYDRDLEDIIAAQDEIAQEIVKSLEITLLDTEEERLAQRYQPSFEAYEQLMRGRHEMAKRTADSLAAAEQHFRLAIELEPDYVLPYVYLADTYGLQIDGSLVTEMSIQRRLPLIQKALELDPLSSEAYMARAYLHAHQEIMTGEESPISFEEDILKALELNPNNAHAHDWYGSLLTDEGRLEEALTQVRLASKLDPMSPDIQQSIANAVWNTGRAEEALTLTRHNIERTPEFPDNYATMSWFHNWLGHLGEALRWRQESRRRDPGNAYSWLFECLGFLNLGDDPAAEDCYNQLSNVHPEKIIAQGSWAVLHVYRGEWNSAITTLESRSRRVPGWRPFDRELANLHAGQGDLKNARRLMAKAFPELLENEPKVSADNLNSALVFAAIFHANGETQRRDILLLAMEERITTMHRVRGTGYGIMDVYIHAMRGDHTRAISGLREAIDDGWRVARPYPLDGSWWTLRQDWKLGSLRQHPEFITLMNELEADISTQRLWFEENKDNPLF